MTYFATFTPYGVRATLSGVAQTRIATRSCSPELHWKSPTRNATRYVDIFGVVENLRVCFPAPGPGVSDSIGLLEIPVSAASTTREMSYVALKAGSSKEGKARRASVGSNCVTA